MEGKLIIFMQELGYYVNDPQDLSCLKKLPAGTRDGLRQKAFAVFDEALLAAHGAEKGSNPNKILDIVARVSQGRFDAE